MYLPTWLIILAIGIGIYLYFKNKGSNHIEMDSNDPERIWEQADYWMDSVLEKGHLDDFLQDEKDMVREMQKDMIRLRERHKHNEQKQKEIANDWYTYANSVYKVKTARQLLDVNMDDDAFETYSEDTKEANIAIQEIGERVEKELGEHSCVRRIHDRLRRHSEMSNQVMSDSIKKSIKEVILRKKKNKEPLLIDNNDIRIIMLSPNMNDMECRMVSAEIGEMAKQIIKEMKKHKK